MAKSQLKQNQLYLIKLKIVKVVTNLEIIQPQLGNYSTTIGKLFNHNWEIIQPQFLIGQHLLVFDKRKFKKK